jgi:hypothetical protein
MLIRRTPLMAALLATWSLWPAALSAQQGPVQPIQPLPRNNEPARRQPPPEAQEQEEQPQQPIYQPQVQPERRRAGEEEQAARPKVRYRIPWDWGEGTTGTPFFVAASGGALFRAAQLNGPALEQAPFLGHLSFLLGFGDAVHVSLVGEVNALPDGDYGNFGIGGAIGYRAATLQLTAFGGAEGEEAEIWSAALSGSFYIPLVSDGDERSRVAFGLRPVAGLYLLSADDVRPRIWTFMAGINLIAAFGHETFCFPYKSF